ncbi:WD40-repeat-containing domain protein [Mycena rebaudengoi]|nr:WD40-repeat-containing domain protein [Mycena rebaudengoi]
MSALLASPDFSSTSAPLKSCTLSSSAYVLSLAALPSFYAASASAPANTIDLFDKSTFRGHTLPGHEHGTTSLRAVPRVAASGNPTLVSSGLDGSIKVWDERTTSHAIKMTNLGQARGILCCDVSPDGLTVAGGTQLQGEDAYIVYWDPRQPAAPLRTHGSTHSDDVTVVEFCPSDRNVLLSASTDGLISTSTVDEADEDEAVLHVGAWGTSVSQAGWTASSSSTKIWAASDMETFSTWSDELDALRSEDIRAPTLHTHHQHTWVTDYLITCRAPVSDAVSDALGVFVGSNEGDVALLTSPMDAGATAPPWTLRNVWATGHAGIVRALLWDEQNNTLLTGGEDGKINVWAGSSSSSSATAPADDAMDVDGDLPAGRRRREWDDDNEQEAGKRARR